MHMMARSGRALAALCVLACMAPVYARTQQCGDPTKGPVLGGVDLVAAVRQAGLNTSDPFGSSDNAVLLGNYTFWFQSPGNALEFTHNATAYVPRYGGYCGIAMTGHDDCCAPLKYCLGPTCTKQHLSYGSFGGRLVFFFGSMVAAGWEKNGRAAQNLADADANWASVVQQRSIPPVDAVRHPDIPACFNTDYLWCLVFPVPPPPFPQCGNNTMGGIRAQV